MEFETFCDELGIKEEDRRGDISNEDGLPYNLFSLLSSAKKTAELKEISKRVIKNLGFTDFSLSVSNQPGKHSISTFAPGINAYLRDSKNLLAEHSRCSSKTLYFSDVEPFVNGSPSYLPMYESFQKMIQVAKSVGINDCYVMPIEHRSVKLLFLLGKESSTSSELRGELIEPRKELLHFIISGISVAFVELFSKPYVSENIGAAPSKGLQLLTCMAKEDLYLKDAAPKLNISLDTANKYIGAAKKMLGANSPGHAVYLAVKRGLISDE